MVDEEVLQSTLRRPDDHHSLSDIRNVWVKLVEFSGGEEWGFEYSAPRGMGIDLLNEEEVRWEGWLKVSMQSLFHVGLILRMMGK